MRNPEHIDRVLQLVGEYWKRNPDLRLGQLVSNFSQGMMDGQQSIAVYQVEDEVLHQRLTDFLVWSDHLDASLGGRPVRSCPKCGSPSTRRRQDKLDEVDPFDQDDTSMASKISDCIECRSCPNIFVLLPGGWFSLD